MKQLELTLSNKISKKITKDMIGLFFEDINFAADGGLYAEMIENRSFEAIKTRGAVHNYVLKEDNLYAWQSSQNDDNALEISMNQPVSKNNPHYLRFTAKKAGDGFYNKAYDGISLKKGAKYNISFYAREVEYPEGNINVCIKKDDKVFGQTAINFNNATNRPKEWMDTIRVTCDTLEWKLYQSQLIAQEDVQGAKFELSLTNAGSVEFDLISMIPQDAVCGIFRKDLFESLKNLKPSFLRFPGGCIVEGTSIMHRYQWKNTIGKIEERKIIPNLWASQGGNTLTGLEIPDCHYMQSYGIGFYEYFLLCELLSSDNRKCKPLPVVGIGVACQFRSYETVPFNSKEFNKYVQDALDLIEFANGSVKTKWGNIRAKMGHPKPFNLEFIGIGNEQWESGAVDLEVRYKAFEKAIHKKYPKIKCIGTAGPFIKNEMHAKAWDFYYMQAKKNKKIAYAVDEHYYVEPQWLYDNVDLYDNYPRDIPVFAGEYASHDKNLSNSVESAIAEASMMTGMERNGDIVKLASYAPLFNRIGHSHWTPDMIWFDSDTVVLTPTYYVQKLFSENSGCFSLELNNQEKTLRQEKVYISYVQDDKNSKILKLVNANSEPIEIYLKDANNMPISINAKISVLSASSEKAKIVEPTLAINSDPNAGTKAVAVGSITNLELCRLRAPEESKIVTEEKELKEKITLPAKSLVVIKY